MPMKDFVIALLFSSLMFRPSNFSEKSSVGHVRCSFDELRKESLFERRHVVKQGCQSRRVYCRMDLTDRANYYCGPECPFHCYDFLRAHYQSNESSCSVARGLKWCYDSGLFPASRMRTIKARLNAALPDLHQQSSKFPFPSHCHPFEIDYITLIWKALKFGMVPLGDVLLMCITPLIVTFLMIGNLISILGFVYQSRQKDKSPYGLQILLTVSDVISVLLALFFVYYNAIFKYLIPCYVFEVIGDLHFFQYALPIVSQFILIGITLDRLDGLLSFMAYQFRNKRKRIVLVAIISYVVPLSVSYLCLNVRKGVSPYVKTLKQTQTSTGLTLLEEEQSMFCSFFIGSFILPERQRSNNLTPGLYPPVIIQPSQSSPLFYALKYVQLFPLLKTTTRIPYCTQLSSKSDFQVLCYLAFMISSSLTLLALSLYLVHRYQKQQDSTVKALGKQNVSQTDAARVLKIALLIESTLNLIVVLCLASLIFLSNKKGAFAYVYMLLFGEQNTSTGQIVFTVLPYFRDFVAIPTIKFIVYILSAFSMCQNFVIFFTICRTFRNDVKAMVRQAVPYLAGHPFLQQEIPNPAGQSRRGNKAFILSDHSRRQTEANINKAT